MNIDITSEFKKIVLSSKALKDCFNQKHTNSKYSLDLIISELLYFLKSGVSWNNLRSPVRPKTLYWHYTRFVANNIFLRLFNRIKKLYLDTQNEQDRILLIDSTSIPNKNGINKIGRNKFYKNKRITKLSLMTDVNGFPLSIFFMKGNYHDNSVFDKHIKDATLICSNKNVKVLADKAYASNKNYSLLNSLGFTHIIPPRKNMKIAKNYTYDKCEYIKRIRIEHIFGRLKLYKRINMRYDKYIRNFSGFIYIALSLIGINIINYLKK